LRLADYDRVTARRAKLFDRYRAALPELQFQTEAPGSQAHQFVPALLPSALRGRRANIRAGLADQGIATGAYFCPHLFEQPYFQKVCVASRLRICDDVSARILSLPLFDEMSHQEVDHVAERLRMLMRTRKQTRRPQKPSRVEQPVLVYTRVSRTGGGRQLRRARLGAHLPAKPVLQQGKV
jgi:dTDP-4-amino-4,6-dideoxygalactose transaminase